MKKNLMIITFFLISLTYLNIFHKEQLQTALWILLGIVISTVILVLLFGGWYLAERMKLLRAKRIEAEKQANVLTFSNHGQLWVRDTDHRATWHALHLEQRVYSNSLYQEPTDLEQLAWQTFVSARHKARTIEGQALPPLLPAPTEPIDLLTALDSAQRCLIVGPSDSGKTTLLQHIITRRLSSSKVVVIDPHAYPGKWAGCKVIGIGRNYAEIDDALQSLIQLMTQRYQEIGRGEVKEETHPRITVVIDEWRAIVFNVKAAAQAIATLLTESRKAAFSVFVGTHSERVKALGIEGEGDLKDGFVIIRLSWLDGKRVATVDYGEGERPTTLPGPFAVSHPQTDVIDVELPMVEPNETEQKVLTLHKEGLSKAEICRQVWGSVGGKQYRQIDEILTRFGEK